VSLYYMHSNVTKQLLPLFSFPQYSVASKNMAGYVPAWSLTQYTRQCRAAITALFTEKQIWIQCEDSSSFNSLWLIAIFLRTITTRASHTVLADGTVRALSTVDYNVVRHRKAHDTRPKFLVRDSGTRTWAENLGRVPWA